MSNTNALVQKVWSFATVLRDDGVGYGDYLEQITYLLFLKMVDEQRRPPYDKDIHLPDVKVTAGEGGEVAGAELWETLAALNGAELETFYNALLRTLAGRAGMLGQIFTKRQNKIQDPAKLARVIRMIDEQEWTLLGTDVKGDLYEGLLEKNAEDTKSGAGQYFTPRPLISAMVDCLQPQPKKTIVDPACGTGGFFLAAYDFLTANHELDRDEKQFLKQETFHGNEIVAGTRRLCLMNMYLHGIGEIDGEPRISPNDALITDSGDRYDYVLANPPFGKKSSMTITNEDGSVEKQELKYSRQDFWATTSNKQLNFLQHIRTLLKTNGQAAVVLPDNILFEGGAGETVRQQLLKVTDLHTILRLPTGIFYAHGVKANVLFFDNKPAAKTPWTRDVWIYDYRTNIHHTLKKLPLRRPDLQEFVDLYRADNRAARAETWSEDTPDGRWRKYSYDEIVVRDKTNLDIFWLRDDSLTDLENLPAPEVIAEEIIEGIEAALEDFRGVLEELSE